MDLNEILIEEVRSRPILYDLGDQHYKNIRKKEYVWKEVVQNVKLSEVECKKRWKGLRDSYKRCKRMQQIASGSSAETPKKQWKYFHCLTFLDNVTSSRQTIGNINDDDDVIVIDPIDICLSPYSESSESKKAKKRNKNEKFHDFLDMAASSISNTCQTFAKIRDEQDNTATHFLCLAKKIKDAKIPPHITNRIEAQVSNLVFNEIKKFFDKQ